MGEPEDQKQIFFTNLLLLGFDTTAMERKWKIPFNKEMFVLPNKKGFETVMHFLFSRLNPVQCKEEFRDCWPVLDKKCEQQFRKVCSSWLSQIVKEDPDAVFPRIVPSLLMSPGGDRIYELLLYFTTYVMVRVMQGQHGVKKKDYLRHPLLTSSAQSSGLGQVMAKTVRCGIVRSRTRFLEQTQQTIDVQDHWKQYGGEQVKAFRSLTKAGRSKEQDLRSISATGSDLNSSSTSLKRRSMTPDYDYDIQSVKRAQKVQKVRDMWQTLEQYISTKEGEQEVVESILEGSLEKYKLDGRELNPRVPDMLLRECEQEIQRRGVDNIYQGGKLNLLSLIHLWNLCLHFYIDKLNKEGVPSFTEAMPTVTSQSHTHHAHYSYTQSLRLKLEMEFLPELKENISKLKSKLDTTLLQNRSPGALRTTSLGLGLLPPSPPVSFEPDTSKTPQGRESRVPLTHNLKMPADLASTPEAAAELISNISDKVRTQCNSRVQGSPAYGPKGRTVISHQPQTRPPSKLPTKGKVEVEKVGSKQRTRFRSAPTGQKSNSSSHKLAEPSHPEELSPPEEPLHEIQEQSHITTGPQRTEPPVFKVPHSTGHVGRAARIQKASSSHTTSQQTPLAQRILADRIADAVAGSTAVHPSTDGSPELDYINNPGTEFTSEAFQPRDKIARTPATASRTWQHTQLYDSVGPLSSTHVDVSGKSTTSSKKDQIATKLFDNDSDTEEASPPKSPSVSHLPGMDRIRATSIGGVSSISSISPRSDVSLGHIEHGRVIATDSSVNDNNRTLVQQSDSDFLLEETPSKKKGGGSQQHTPERLRKVEFQGYNSPFGKTARQRELAADSLVDKVLSCENSPDPEERIQSLLANLEPAHDIAQSLLDTKTPHLPSRSRSLRSEAAGAATEEQLSKGIRKSYTSPKQDPEKSPGLSDPFDLEADVRVISFQNGSFSEFMDKSPVKRLHEQSDVVRTKSTPSPRKSPKSSSKGVSPLKVVQQQLDNETDRIIARYKQLKQKADADQNTETTSLDSGTHEPPRRLTERDVVMGGHKQKPLPLISETPTMSFTDSYLKTSPPAGKYGNLQQPDMTQSIVVQKFTLDLDSDDDQSESVARSRASERGPSANRNTHAGQRSSPKPQQTLHQSTRLPSGEELSQQELPDVPLDDLETSLASVDLDAGHSAPQPVQLFGTAPLSMSPYTDAIHKEPSPVRHKTWGTLLKETSATARTSPQKPSVPTVPVANLIDL